MPEMKVLSFISMPIKVVKGEQIEVDGKREPIEAKHEKESKNERV